MVVYRHSLNYYAFYGVANVAGWNAYIQGGIMSLTEIAVPFFFLISGFFFLKVSYNTKQAYVKMLKKKSFTLLFPFLIWNIVGGMVLWGYDRSLLGNTYFDVLKKIFLSEYYGPLWYVRDIILFMMLVPLYEWALRKNMILLFFVALITFVTWIPVDCSLMSSEGIFFFLLGGILWQYQYVIELKTNKCFLFVLFIIWVAISFNVPLFQYSYLHKINTLIGLWVAWQLFDYLCKSSKAFIYSIAEYTFLIYTLHFYILKTMKVILGKVFFKNDMVSLLAFLLLPLVTATIIISIGKLMQRYAPKIYSVATGNR